MVWTVGSSVDTFSYQAELALDIDPGFEIIVEGALEEIGDRFEVPGL